MDMTKSDGNSEKLGKQQTKSLRARETIIAATIESLFEVGYAETSLNRVADRAGVSKGAVQHHFPSKEVLITATADSLLQRPLLPPKRAEDVPRSLRDAILYSWNRMVNTPAYRALLEILIAARTDKELQDRISDNLRAWNEEMDKQSARAYEAIGGNEEDAMEILTMSRSLMRGLVIQDRYSDPQENLKYIHRWIDMITPHLRLKERQQV